MSLYRTALFIGFILSIHSLFGQNCQLSIKGQTTDGLSGDALESVLLQLKGASTTQAISNSQGNFQFNKLCEGNYTLTAHFLGRLPIEVQIDLRSDTTLSIAFQALNEELLEVGVSAPSIPSQSGAPIEINEQQLLSNADLSLADQLQKMANIQVIRNGPSIGKPIVHGLTGNRLPIIYQGAPQSGQQWGNDHAPEIDPLSSHQITLVRGAASLAYPKAAQGAMILIEAADFPATKAWHGKAGYTFNTNGGLHSSLLQLGRVYENIAWRGQLNYRKGGDMRSPNYYLRNTGLEQLNGSFDIRLFQKKNVEWKAHFSSYNADLGILRGSHISNLTDLEEALERDVPFFTEEEMSYSIDAPSQRVGHQTAQLKFLKRWNEKSQLLIDYSFQYDQREEYDVRRGGRSATPALKLDQWAHFTSLAFKWNESNFSFHTGAQWQFVENKNDPKTGILPLIPDYISDAYALFFIGKHAQSNYTIDWGLRYDIDQQQVAAISRDVPRRILNYTNNFSRFSAQWAIDYEYSSEHHLRYDIGYAQRNPEVNELYSNGLHQGVSSIEEGNPELKQEVSLKNSLQLTGPIGKYFHYEVLAYLHFMPNYIFLQPQDSLRLTIRGAYPLFQYEQTDARIYGFDAGLAYEWKNTWQLKVNYNFLRGDDLTNAIPLVQMPANTFSAQAEYRWPHKANQNWDLVLSINHRFVARQNYLLPEQDFVLPPDAYHLTGLQTQYKWTTKSNEWLLTLRVDNLFNQVYRDYLNRLRYFADETGTNVSLGLLFQF